jgi:hypothetical protein
MQLNVGLGDLGMDSLVAIEMRSWWKTTFGFDISVLELLGMGSLQALRAMPPRVCVQHWSLPAKLFEDGLLFLEDYIFPTLPNIDYST